MESREKIKLKTIEMFLQNIGTFTHKPSYKLEQYITPPRLAAEILFTINQEYEGFENNIVCDLGCGTGMLMIGALRIGAEFVTGFDIDERCLEAALGNIEEYGVEECTDLVLQ